MKTLLSAKPKLMARNPYGETALMIAALRGHTEIVRMLLGQGAPVDHPGWTPLIYASVHGRLDIMKC